MACLRARLKVFHNYMHAVYNRQHCHDKRRYEGISGRRVYDNTVNFELKVEAESDSMQGKMQAPTEVFCLA